VIFALVLSILRAFAVLDALDNVRV